MRFMYCVCRAGKANAYAFYLMEYTSPEGEIFFRYRYKKLPYRAGYKATLLSQPFGWRTKMSGACPEV